ncbi:hypothetical protein NRIC_29880 [Enterococcus florum]|uniref:DUF2000 domain-containing protein n=1 Tax=Enterococcus florum TaxID=2480627 RepID=A0A4P5PAH7_9ENTE|nr:DUF2000 domain-containing protein [Enterococcus florum]GCF95097.1 hypothetical protein NRIC_29880 [Enterococcus florum]
MFDTKISIVLREDLEMWQKLNVTAFLMSGIAGTQDIIGEVYRDKDGNEYLPMSKQPIMIYSSNGEKMLQLLNKSRSKQVVSTIYTEELFTTYNDEDNRAVIADIHEGDLNLVGVALRGKKTHVDKLFKGFELHK